MSYKIEKNIPGPQVHDLSWLEELEVGDSFLMPTEDAIPSRVQNIYNWGNAHRPEIRRFKTRRESGGRRFWRVL